MSFAHSPTFPSLHLHHSSFSNPHSPTFPSLHLCHSLFSNPSIALPTSQLILQPFHCFTYITALSPTLLSLLLCHWLFTYVIWQAAHEDFPISHSSIAAVVEDGDSYSTSCWLWRAICNKVFECTEHSADWNLSAISHGFAAPYCTKLSRSTCCSENCASGGHQSNWHQNTKQSSWSQHWRLWSIFSYTSINSCPVSICRMTERRRWLSHKYDSVDPGGTVVILASGSKVRGFNPGLGRWIFSERKHPEYDFLRKGSKAVSPVS